MLYSSFNTVSSRLYASVATSFNIQTGLPIMQTASSTSLHGQSATLLSPGETIMYVITLSIPAGQTPSLVISTTLSPSTMQILNSTIYIGSNVNSTKMNTGSSAAQVNAATGYPGTVTFDMGQVLVSDSSVINLSPSSNAAAMGVQMVIFMAPAAPSATNVQGNTLSLSTSLTGNGTTISSNSTSWTIVEPTLKITSSNTPVNVQGGDVITFTLTIGHTASSQADALGLSITSALLPNFLVVPGTVATTGASAVITSGNSLNVYIPKLALGASSITVTFNAALWTFAQSNSTIYNPTNLGYASTLDNLARSYSAAASSYILTGDGNMTVTWSGDVHGNSPTLLSIGEIVSITSILSLPAGKDLLVNLGTNLDYTSGKFNVSIIHSNNFVY